VFPRRPGDRETRDAEPPSRGHAGVSAGLRLRLYGENAMNTVRTIAAVSAALLLGSVAAARPTNYTSAVATNPGDWSDPNNWSPAGVPAAGDTVTISNGDVVVVTDYQEITTVTIDSGCRLDIDWDGSGANAELRFLQPSGSAALVINAANGLRIRDGNSTLSFGVSVRVQGSGSLQGEHNSAIIDLVPANGATVELRNDAEFHGAMVIKKTGAGTGNFKNGSRVLADMANGTLLLDASLSAILAEVNASSACGTYDWEVQGASSTLQFDKGTTALVGYFRVDAGVMTINANVQTSGKKKLENSGSINGSASFTSASPDC
jgi:hypothetical protein